MSAIADRLVEMICEELVLDAAQVQPDSLLLADLDVDSISLIELVFSIEKEFGVDFPDVKASEQTFAATLPAALGQPAGREGAANLLEFVASEAVGGGGEAPTAAAVGRQSLGNLAAAVGGRVPADLDAETPLTEVRVGQLLRIVTIETLARYVAYLRRAAAGSRS